MQWCRLQHYNKRHDRSPCPSHSTTVLIVNAVIDHITWSYRWLTVVEVQAIQPYTLDHLTISSSKHYQGHSIITSRAVFIRWLSTINKTATSQASNVDSAYTAKYSKDTVVWYSYNAFWYCNKTNNKKSVCLSIDAVYIVWFSDELSTQSTQRKVIRSRFWLTCQTFSSSYSSMQVSIASGLKPFAVQRSMTSTILTVLDEPSIDTRSLMVE